MDILDEIRTINITRQTYSLRSSCRTAASTMGRKNRSKKLPTTDEMIISYWFWSGTSSLLPVCWIMDQLLKVWSRSTSLKRHVELIKPRICLINTSTNAELLNLHFTFKHFIWLNFASFESFQSNQLVAFLFILNLHEPEPGPKSRVLDWLRRIEVKVFVSLCSYSTGRCARGSEQIGIETAGKNNGERIIK